MTSTTTDTERIVLDGPLAQARGVIGRYPDPDEEFVFEFDRVSQRLIHMIGVRRPLRVRWFVDGELQADETLDPWIGWGYHRADRIIELRPC